jgi:hypothetical protein
VGDSSMTGSEEEIGEFVAETSKGSRFGIWRDVDGRLFEERMVNIVGG